MLIIVIIPSALLILVFSVPSTVVKWIEYLDYFRSSFGVGDDL